MNDDPMKWWEPEFGVLVSQAWAGGLWHSESELTKSLKVFIARIETESYERGFRKGVATPDCTCQRPEAVKTFGESVVHNAKCPARNKQTPPFA
jgi:hypothetical protein